MECSLGPMGSRQKSTTRFRKLRYERAGRAHGTTNPTREGNRPANTTRRGQGIIRRIIGIPFIQRLRISNNIVTPNIHSTRARQKTNTRGMGASTGVDDKLAAQVVPSINHNNTPHHITAYTFGRSGDLRWDSKIPA